MDDITQISSLGLSNHIGSYDWPDQKNPTGTLANVVST